MRILPSRSATHLLPVLALVVGLLAVVGLTTRAPADAVPAPTLVTSKAQLHGSAKQIWGVGFGPHEKVQVLRGAKVVATSRVSRLGAVLVRDVEPGRYRVRVGGTASGRVVVHGDQGKPWDPKVYRQTLKSQGYGYLTTRDGTQLAYSVSTPTHPASLGIPGLPTSGPGPFPTLVEYSGYGTADPDGPQNGIAVLANLMGFAVVDVSMRGTGCSGGAYDFFEPLQQLDAYDVIETVARQSWVQGHRVGMMGISYGAISQLFAAQYNPPSLAAIAPLSTIDTVATTLFPGGILNDGFALNWAKERIHDALPSSKNGGQDYARDQIAAGDTTCAANQLMHSRALNLLDKIHANEHYVPKVADQLDPIAFVHKIHVPVFLACQFEDEQTGGHCPDLVRHFTGTKKKWFTFTNGAHIDSLDPATFNRWFDFLQIYVAHRAPLTASALVRAGAPVLFQQAMGLPSSDLAMLPNDPIQNLPTLASARKAFERTPRVTVDFENGAGTSPLGDQTPGNPYSTTEAGFSALPAPGTKARSWYLGAKGALGARGGARLADHFRADPHGTPTHSFRGNTSSGGLWGNASQWTYHWGRNKKGTALSYVTAPLKRDTTVLGGGAVYVWVRSDAPDVDLQATVSEVRPDGKETFVQNGWQRASERKLAGKHGSMLKQPSTLLEPFPTLRLKDVAPMPRHRFVKVAIPLYYQGHLYRSGSRIRVVISGVNGTQPIWSFVETHPRHGTSGVAIGHGTGMPSRLVLPVVGGVDVPKALPPCPGLRNEPCRAYVPIANRTTRLR